MEIRRGKRGVLWKERKEGRKVDVTKDRGGRDRDVLSNVKLHLLLLLLLFSLRFPHYVHGC